MIAGSLETLNNYGTINPGFEAAFQLIRKSIANNEADGKYESEKGLYYLVLTYEARPVAEGEFETHRKYIDVQYIVEGIERMQWLPLCRKGEGKGYNPEKDVEFYTDVPDSTEIIAASGEFYIFMPDDVHKPSLRLENKAAKVKKIVVKVPVARECVVNEN